MVSMSNSMRYTKPLSLVYLGLSAFAIMTAFHVVLDQQNQKCPAYHKYKHRPSDSLPFARGYKRYVAAGQADQSDARPTLYVITPTYARLVQKAELTGLKNTLLHVRNLHWIVVEDAERRTERVSTFLRDSRMSFTHLCVATPAEYKTHSPGAPRARGVLQRNLALAWIREKASNESLSGVVYFADDDNTYSVELFEQMRYTQRISVWPVGLVGGMRYEGPVVRRGRVVDWLTLYKPGRAFPIDMAGFAVNLRLLLSHPDAEFSHDVDSGCLESALLTKLARNMKLSDLEPMADNCTKVLVWHTRTEKIKLSHGALLKSYGKYRNIPQVEV